MVARTSIALFLALPSLALAEFFSYECDSVPGVSGWDLFQATCEAEEQSVEGTLVQVVSECLEFPGFGAQIDYEKEDLQIADTSEFFIEWKLQTTGISEEIPWVAPASFTVSNGNGFVYHFTVADDTARVIVGFQLTLYYDLEPGTFHTYRLEITGEGLGDTFAIYVDGNLIHSDVPDTPLFDGVHQPRMTMRAKSELVPSTTTWDYIRYGEISDNGDFNSDGEVDDQDLPFFEECLETESGNWVGCAWADFEADGDVDCADAVEFQLAWTGAGDPPSFKSCAAVCGEDLNNDDAVDAADLAILLGGWGANPGHAADFNDDDAVNASDLAVLLGNWGPCP